MKKTDKKAFTMVEILVVCGVVALFLAIAITVFSNFRQGYSKSESGAILLQETAMFLARLRSDMNNAVLNPKTIDSGKQFSVEPNQLSFNVYDNHEGKIVPVVYSITGSKEGFDLSRTAGAASPKTLIKNHIASMSWNTEIETFSGPASGTVRISLKLKTTLKTTKGKEKPLTISTHIFPSRLNRQLNK